jgi:hypothetical protein
MISWIVIKNNTQCTGGIRPVATERHSKKMAFRARTFPVFQLTPISQYLKEKNHWCWGYDVLHIMRQSMQSG